MGATTPRVVLVTRKTDYQMLLERHSTHEQARFFLETREQSIDVVLSQHDQFTQALDQVSRAIPVKWRRSRVDRDELDRFLFEPDDIVVALGQDGLVANIAKYLTGQTVVGLNPAPERYDGILVPHPPEAAAVLMQTACDGMGSFERRTMVEAELSDGQRIVALNEIFVGHQTHQSARYSIDWNGFAERQSSSGVVVASGTGSTGWARSILRQRPCDFSLPLPCDSNLSFFVREAFPSIATGTEISEGLVGQEDALQIRSEMNEGGVIFGDGIEEDRIDFHFGNIVFLHRGSNTLNLLL